MRSLADVDDAAVVAVIVAAGAIEALGKLAAQPRMCSTMALTSGAMLKMFHNDTTQQEERSRRKATERVVAGTTAAAAKATAAKAAAEKEAAAKVRQRRHQRRRLWPLCVWPSRRVAVMTRAALRQGLWRLRL